MLMGVLVVVFFFPCENFGVKFDSAHQFHSLAQDQSTVSQLSLIHI